MAQRNNLEYRVNQLEKNFDKLDDKIDLIMTNHLPHIQTDLIKLNTQVKVFTGLNIAAVIIGLILDKFIL
jgi:hypothetical protein